MLAAFFGEPADAGPPVGDGDGGVEAELVADGFDLPTYAAFAPGVADTQYVVQKNGEVEMVVNGVIQPQPFLDIRDKVSTDRARGMFSIAFAPDYQDSGLVYAYYTRNDGDPQIVEFETLSDADADESSFRRVLRVKHPDTSFVHHGGTIVFGPGDNLYASVGDGGGSGDPKESAQDKTKLLGKILRIDPTGEDDGDYTAPAGNPFVGKGGRDEILALGLRNPFRFSIDPVTDWISIGDVGQAKREEVDIETKKNIKGANFGWDHFEGTREFDWPSDNEARRPRRNYEPPVFEYSHKQGNAIIGGPIVRDPNLPTLQGRYLFADHARSELRSFEPKLSGGKREKKLKLNISKPSSFVADADDVVYVTALDDGELYRLVPEP